jgi:hypothetical protein
MIVERRRPPTGKLSMIFLKLILGDPGLAPGAASSADSDRPLQGVGRSRGWRGMNAQVTTMIK